MPASIDPNFHREFIDPSAFIAANATICGQVRIAQQSSVWFGAVVRGDTEWVEIGARSNVQDLSVLHSDPGVPCRIGDDVTIGHAAVVHGATVETGSMIGMRAVVLNGARIGAEAIIAAGALVTEGSEIPAGTLAMGIPAKPVRELNETDRERIKHAAAHYVHAAATYRQAGKH